MPEYALFHGSATSAISDCWGMWDNSGEWVGIYKLYGKWEIDKDNGVEYEEIHQTYWELVEPLCWLHWLRCAKCNNISFDDYLCCECRNHE